MEKPSTIRTCPKCYSTLLADISVCSVGGTRLEGPAVSGPSDPLPYPNYPLPQRTVKPTVGGVLIVLDGVMEFVFGLLYILYGSTIAEITGNLGTGDIVATVGAVWLIFGVVAMIGGCSR